MIDDKKIEGFLGYPGVDFFGVGGHFEKPGSGLPEEPSKKKKNVPDRACLYDREWSKTDF